MDKDQIIHDLTMLHLQKTGDALSPKELVEQYYESSKIFKSALEEYRALTPKPKAQIKAISIY